MNNPGQQDAETVRQRCSRHPWIVRRISSGSERMARGV